MADWVEEQIVKHEWTGNVDNISYGQILVRCKDCKHFTEPDENGFGVCMKIMHGCQYWGFCADGERKEGRWRETPEIVRCKDCTYRDEINCPQYYRRDELTDSYFCADGKRKNEEVCE